MKPVVIDVAEGVRGWLHLPDAATGSGLGVLLVPPVGWEAQSSYRPRKVWADRLAAEGHAALRIDLPGTGDAGGGPHDPDRLGAWVAAVRGAACWLHDVVGAPRVAAIGLQGGGLVVLEAIAAGAPVDRLVLWGTPAGGHQLVRELRAFARLEAAQTGEDPAVAGGNELHCGGHVLAAETVAALDALPPPGPDRKIPVPVLLLGRDGVGPDARLHKALAAAGADVELDPGDGWGAMVATPQKAVPPDESITRIGRFLRSGAPGGVRYAEVTRGEPGFEEEIDALSGPGFREAPFVLGETVGVVTQPCDRAPADVTVVLLNAGALHHAGPNRLWVEASRRWAAERGITTLRLDLEGVGDAGGEAAPYADDLALYAPSLTEQVKAAVDELLRDGGAQRVLLAGLCSGAYWSLHAALDDPRVATVVLLNPRLLFWQADAGSRYELFRAMSVLRRGGLARLRAAEHPVDRLASLVSSLPRLAWSRLRRGTTPETDQLTAALTRFDDRGQRLVLAFSQGDEPLRDELDRTDRWPELDACPAVTRRPLPLTGHTLKGLEAQRAAHAVLDEALDATIAAFSPGTSGTRAADPRVAAPDPPSKEAADAARH